MGPHEELRAKRNTSFTMGHARNLFAEARVDVEEKGLWKRCVEHTRRVEDAFWVNDGIIDELPPLTVTQSDDDTDTDSDCDCDDGTEDTVYTECDDDCDIVCEACNLRDPNVGDSGMADWVECGLCNRWFHKICIENEFCTRCYSIMNFTIY